MNENVTRLIALQEVDRELHTLDESTRQFPEQVRSLESEIATAQGVVDSLSARFTLAKNEHAQMTQAISDAKAAVERSESRLSSISTNREFDALHQEIHTNRAAETSARGRMSALESDETQLQTAITKAQADLAAITEKNAPVIEELKAKIATIDSKRAELLERRAKASQGITPQYLRTYQHILKHSKTGVALTVITSGDRTCAVCHKILETSVFGEVKSGRKIMMCESCGTILLYQD